jgi:hypothetical protein
VTVVVGGSTTVVRPQNGGVTVRVPGDRAAITTVRHVQVKVQMPRTSLRIAPQPVTVKIPTAAAGPPGPVGPVGGVIEGAAATVLGGHRVVWRALDGFRYADAADRDSVDAVAGITLHAAGAGEQVQVRHAGELQLAAALLVAGVAVYLGAAGHLTQTPPSAGDALIVGVALAPDLLLVRIQQPISIM